MKKSVIILLLTLATVNLFAKTSNGDKVDPLIEASFKKQFGSSLNVSWKIFQDIAVATFIEKGEEKQVYYYDDGDIWGFGKIIRRDLLPESIRKSITEKFSSGIIQTVYEFKTTDSPTSYFVSVVTPRYSMIVSTNEFGDISVRQKIKLKSFSN